MNTTIKRLRHTRKLPNPFMKGNDFLQRLKEQPTLEDKRNQIVEANPLLLIFADTIPVASSPIPIVISTDDPAIIIRTLLLKY